MLDRDSTDGVDVEVALAAIQSRARDEDVSFYTLSATSPPHAHDVMMPTNHLPGYAGADAPRSTPKFAARRGQVRVQDHPENSRESGAGSSGKTGMQSARTIPRSTGRLHHMGRFEVEGTHD